MSLQIVKFAVYIPILLPAAKNAYDTACNESVICHLTIKYTVYTLKCKKSAFISVVDCFRCFFFYLEFFV